MRVSVGAKQRQSLGETSLRCDLERVIVGDTCGIRVGKIHNSRSEEAERAAGCRASWTGIWSIDVVRHIHLTRQIRDVKNLYDRIPLRQFLLDAEVGLLRVPGFVIWGHGIEASYR